MQILNSLALFKTAIIKTLAKEVILKKKKRKKSTVFLKTSLKKEQTKNVWPMGIKSQSIAGKEARQSARVPNKFIL